MSVTYDPTAKFDVKVFEEIYRTGDDGEWPVRLYQPQGPGPFPAMLDVHGGAWNRGTYLDNENIDQALAACGILVAAIEFRRAPDHIYPSQIIDANFGTRWLKALAADFNADPDSVGALGTSSGGHTLMSSALRPNDPRYASLKIPGATADASVCYVMAGWPVLDSHARYIYAKTSGEDRLMKSSENYFGTEDVMREGNPQMVLDRGEQTHMPPMLILQGTADSNVPLGISENFEKTYRASGGTVTREVFLDMPHAFARQPGPDTDRAIAIMKDFIAQQFA